jgi:dihydrofolate synthase/folylpolyglutamate synthase
VDFDHQEYLGYTLESIAREKAGVFRPGRAAILGSRDPPAILTSLARSVGALPKQLGRDFDYVRADQSWRYRSGTREYADLPLPALAGEVQFGNASTALAALEELEPRFKVSPEAVARALREVRLTGRFQMITPPFGKASWILDVAHNPGAARVLAANLRASRPAGRTFAVCGILADKDAPAIAAQLHDCFDAWWLTATETTRGTSAAGLAERIAPHIQAPLTLTSGIAEACDLASAAATAGDRIVVFGSFHTVGPALDWLERQQASPREQ